MISTLLGKKLGMTQVYDSQNCLVPVTVVEAGPCPVLQVKTKAKDGYNAVQIGFGKKKASRLKKAEAGHAKAADTDLVSTLREVRSENESDAKVGDVVTVEAFQEGQIIDVIGITKGKGFQGVVKRFRVAGGPASHGSMFHRRIGSIGQRQTPGHTFKNQKMPGHMGQERRTVQNLKIVKILPEKNLLLVRGAVPGATGDVVVIRAGIKAKAKA
jgi:large subunit ribosomal protein L3